METVTTTTVEPNPWLDVDPEEYEFHMGERCSGQGKSLSLCLRDAVNRFRPRTVAIIGCGIGIGLEHLRGDLSVTCTDINAGFLRAARNRLEGNVKDCEFLLETFKDRGLPRDIMIWSI